MKDLLEILARLSEANGAPGFEDEVREIIREMVSPYVDRIEVDKLGNLIAVKGSGEPKVMVAAHMDEVALMVRHIEDNGFIRVVNVGGINPYILLAREVVVYTEKGKVYGVIGIKPPHLLREVKELKVESLYLDVGAKSKEEVAELGIEVGDYAFFTTKFRKMSNGFVMGKAFDDRIGCSILVKLVQELSDFKGTLYAAFTVQEEVGLRGAGVAAYAVNPDVAIVLEGTIASDTPDTSPQEQITRIGEGPALRVMDATIITHRKLLKFVKQVAREIGVPYQLQISPRSGTDAGRIHLTRAGIPSIALSVPCRYIHSPCSMAKVSDIENTYKLLLEVVRRIHGFKI